MEYIVSKCANCDGCQSYSSTGPDHSLVVSQCGIRHGSDSARCPVAKYVSELWSTEMPEPLSTPCNSDTSSTPLESQGRLPTRAHRSPDTSCPKPEPNCGE